MTDVEAKVLSILAERAVRQVSELHPDMRLDQIGIDSLGMAESIFAIEETFGVSVPFNANEPGQGGFDLTSVGAVISAVESLVAARP